MANDVKTAKKEKKPNLSRVSAVILRTLWAN